MTNTTPERFWNLLSEAVGGTLSDEQVAQLEELLDSDELRRLFMQHLQLDVDLREFGRSRRVADSVLALVHEKEESSQSAVTLTPRSKSLLDRASRHPLVPSLGVTVAIFVALLVGLASIPVGKWIASTGKDPESRQPEAPTSSEFVAILNSSHEAKWLDETQPRLNDPRLKVGRRLAIASGLLEVKYYSGVRVVIEGPADFTVGDQQPEDNSRGSTSRRDAANGGYLKRGKLVAHVEGKKAEGFTIDTPSGRVEDLGTEFGVEAKADGRTDVHVFTGKVKVATAGQNGSHLPAVTLSKNQSLVVQRGVKHSIVRSAVKRGDFIASLPDHSAALEAGLVAHWKMDDRAESRLVQAEVGSDGTFSQNTREVSVEGRDGLALKFDRQHFVRINAPGRLLRLPEFTVAAWVRNYDGGESNVVFAWSDGTWESRMQVELHEESMVSYFGGAGNRVDRGDKLDWSANQWYHVAWSQSSTGELRMYRDGRLVGGPFQNRPAPKSLRLNRADIGSLYGRPDHTFSGDIDDFQMYRRALSPEELMSLSRRPGMTLPASNDAEELPGDIQTHDVPSGEESYQARESLPLSPAD